MEDNVIEEMYARHFPLISREEQEKIAKKRVTVVGAGALGSWEAYFLKKLGVENIRVIDRDFVDITDLPRTVYEKEDIGKPKVDALKEKLGILGYFEDLNPGTIEMLDGSDLVMDGTDNIYTRELINDYCVKNRIPWIYVGILSYYGNIMPIIPGKTACFRCMIPSLPSRPMPTCATEGIMSYIAPFAASLAVALCAKILLDEKIDNKMIFFDLKNMEFNKIEIPKREDCDCCAYGNFIFLKKIIKIERDCEGAFIVTPPERMNVNIDEMEIKLKNLGKEYINLKRFIQFMDDDKKIIIFDSGRMVIKGAHSEKEAKNIFVRYMGD